MLDIIFLIILVFYFIKGYRTGLILAIIKGIALVIALVIATHFSVALSRQIFGDNVTGLGQRLFPLFSFSILFFIIKYFITLLGIWIQKAFSLPLVGTINRLGGGIFYSLIFIFIASIFLHFLEKLNLVNTDNPSIVIKNLLPISPIVFDMVGKIIPFAKDTYAQLDTYISSLSLDNK